MTDTNLAIIHALREFIDGVHEKKWFIENKNHFTVDDSKLNFQRLVSLILNLPKKSISLEIEEFFQVIGKPELSCTKSAFTQQRSKLSFQFFSALNAKLLEENHLQNSKSFKRWKGFILCGVDGSTINLVDKPDIREFFGTQSNNHTDYPQGRIMCIYDVLNHVTVACDLFPITISEQEIIKHWVEITTSEYLLLYDRGFPSYVNFFLHDQQEKPVHYVMRAKPDMSKTVAAFANSKKRDAVLTLKANNKNVNELHRLGYKIKKGMELKVRAIKVKLKNGETEILLTNLFDRLAYPTSIFKDLYFKRWGIETNYDVQKNCMQLECFSGTKVNSILQEFYASVFICNLQSILANSCYKKLQRKTEHRKHEYKTNKNLAIGLMKNKVPLLLLHPSPQKILEQLLHQQLKFHEPVRPNRSYPRNKHSRRRLTGRHQTELTYKRVL